MHKSPCCQPEAWSSGTQNPHAKGGCWEHICNTALLRVRSVGAGEGAQEPATSVQAAGIHSKATGGTQQAEGEHKVLEAIVTSGQTRHTYTQHT